jgi:DNA-binding CsgD family transcriptional regulator
MATRRTGERITLSLLQETHFSGDFELCLTMCDAFKQRDATDAAEVILLRARCLVQLGRGDHAIEVLRGLRLRDDQHDEYLIGRILMSAAYVELCKYDEGLKVAREVYNEIGNAHSTVRAEVTLNLAVAHYRKGHYAAASRFLDLIPETEDIIYVRALQFRGGVAWAQGNFAGSLSMFHDALTRLDRCRHRDRFTEAKLLFSLAYLCGELPCVDLWPELLSRVEQFDWSVGGVAVWRFWIAIEASFISEMLGDLNASTRWALEAEEVAPDPASLIEAWLRLAARFGHNGEKGAHAYLTVKASRKYDEFLKDARLKEYKSLSIDIASEVLYSNEPLAASRLVTYFAEVMAPTTLGNGTEGRQMQADYLLVQGQLDEYRRNRGKAHDAYQRAHEIYRVAGLMRRAAIVAYRLFVLTGDMQYATFVTEALPGVSGKYWVKAKLAKSRTEARLTKKQLEVVRLIAQGKSNKEIATARGISISRAKNAVAEIFTIFGVHSRAELATLVTTRGLLQPSTVE